MEDLYTTIEKYISGELSGQELAAFEKKLKTDASLAEEVKLFKQAKESLADHFVHEEEESALKATFAEVSPAFFKENKKQARIIPLIRKYGLPATGIAAAILILIVFNPLQGSLYNQFGEFPTAAFIEQGGAAESELVQAQQAFNQEEYTTARNIFRQHLDQEVNNNDVEIQLYLGLSHLALEEYTPATDIFQTIQSGSSAYKNEGIWFLALTALKQKDWEKCSVLLEQIPEGSSRREDAERLLEKIRRKN